MATYSFGLMRKFSTGRLGVVLPLSPRSWLLRLRSLAAPAAHAAKPDDATEMKAREAFAAGRYDEALELFAKLYAQTLHPVYLRNIGRCHQKMRQPEKAIDKFSEYLAKEKKISADERKEIDGYIKEMETLRDEQAQGRGAAAAAAGCRRSTPSNPPPPPPANLQLLAAAAATTLRDAGRAAAASQEEAPIYKKWWFWTGIGAVVAGGVVAAVLLSSGGTTRPDCPDGVTCKP